MMNQKYMKKTTCILSKTNGQYSTHHKILQHKMLTLSPVMAKGALNHCSNVLQLLKMVGRRKLSRAQSSGSLF